MFLDSQRVVVCVKHLWCCDVVSIRTVTYRPEIGDEMVCLLNAELGGDDSKKPCCTKSFDEISAEKMIQSDRADQSAHSRGSADISCLSAHIVQTPQFQIVGCACHDDATQAQHRVGALMSHHPHPSGSRHPRHTGAVTTGGRGWLDRTHEHMVPEHATNTHEPETDTRSYKHGYGVPCALTRKDDGAIKKHTLKTTRNWEQKKCKHELDKNKKCRGQKMKENEN